MKPMDRDFTAGMMADARERHEQERMLKYHFHARSHHRWECQCADCIRYGCDYDNGKPCEHCLKRDRKSEAVRYRKDAGYSDYRYGDTAE